MLLQEALYLLNEASFNTVFNYLTSIEELIRKNKGNSNLNDIIQKVKKMMGERPIAIEGLKSIDYSILKKKLEEIEKYLNNNKNFIKQDDYRSCLNSITLLKQSLDKSINPKDEVYSKATDIPK